MTVCESRSDPESDQDGSVWYAVYGSNLSRNRFVRYLEGGRPTQNARAHRRCPAGTQVQRDEPIRLGFELYFARKSRQWDGGVAFVRIKRVKPPPTLGRAYLLTLPQLVHVAREENGGQVRVQITKQQLLGSPVEVTGSGQGWYRVLLPCGSIDGIPVVTLTGWPAENARHQNSPSEDYLNFMRSGLHESYPNISDFDVERYIEKAIERHAINSRKIHIIIREICRRRLHQFVRVVGRFVSSLTEI